MLHIGEELFQLLNAVVLVGLLEMEPAFECSEQRSAALPQYLRDVVDGGRVMDLDPEQISSEIGF